LTTRDFQIAFEIILFQKIQMQQTAFDRRKNTLQQEIIRQITMLDDQIARLSAEREVLGRTLTRVRNDQVANKEVNRKNSVNKVVLENAIFLALKLAGAPVKVADLYNDVSFGLAVLNHGTFRSALHRMKESGSVASPSRGKWMLSATPK
jgi:hypothetical protein